MQCKATFVFCQKSENEQKNFKNELKQNSSKNNLKFNQNNDGKNPQIVHI